MGWTPRCRLDGCNGGFEVSDVGHTLGDGRDARVDDPAGPRLEDVTDYVNTEGVSGSLMLAEHVKVVWIARKGRRAGGEAEEAVTFGPVQRAKETMSLLLMDPVHQTGSSFI